MAKMVTLPWKNKDERDAANFLTEVMREEGYTVRILPGEVPLFRQAIVTPPKTENDNV